MEEIIPLEIDLLLPPLEASVPRVRVDLGPYGDLSGEECEALRHLALQTLYGSHPPKRIVFKNASEKTWTILREVLQGAKRMTLSYGCTNGHLIVERVGRKCKDPTVVSFEIDGKTYPVVMGERRKKMKRVINRDGKKCVWCSMELDYTHPFATLDHLIPNSRRGSDGVNNSLLSCDSCNTARGNNPAITWIIIAKARGQKVREDVIWHRLAYVLTN
jgi:hypothetical protein